MKPVEKMTDEKLIHWATKTGNTLSKNYHSIGENYRCTLVDRYHELKEEMQDRGIWDKYCKNSHSCPTHDAYDFGA